jgi:hypothetical protein
MPTKEELMQQAADLDIEGRSTMNKAELEAALADAGAPQASTRRGEAVATAIGITVGTDDDPGWRWSTRSADGESIYTATESFSNRGAAVRQARAAHPGLPITIANRA